MICDQGVKILALMMHGETPQCLVEGPDGKHQVCDVLGWFVNGDQPRRTTGPELADTFAFEVHGFDKDGDPAHTRYDAKLEGLGDEILRAADGTFGSRRAREVEARFMANPAMLPGLGGGPH